MKKEHLEQLVNDLTLIDQIMHNHEDRIKKLESTPTALADDAKPLTISAQAVVAEILKYVNDSKMTYPEQALARQGYGRVIEVKRLVEFLNKLA